MNVREFKRRMETEDKGTKKCANCIDGNHNSCDALTDGIEQTDPKERSCSCSCVKPITTEGLKDFPSFSTPRIRRG